MILVIDTSVVVKWFVDEPGRLPARAILGSKVDLAAPDFMIAEVGNVLWRKQRAGDIDRDQIDDALKELPRFFETLTPARDLIVSAMGFARELGHSIYDCLFLALAVQLDTRLVTADDRFITKLSSLPQSRFLLPLGTYSPASEH
jgi:predicted nucleic acid-binding protein